MPSPEDLKYKIILKAKMLPDMLTPDYDVEDGVCGYGEMSGDEESDAESEAGGTIKSISPQSPTRLTVNQSVSERGAVG